MYKYTKQNGEKSEVIVISDLELLALIFLGKYNLSEGFHLDRAFLSEDPSINLFLIVRGSIRGIYQSLKDKNLVKIFDDNRVVFSEIGIIYQLLMQDFIPINLHIRDNEDNLNIQKDREIIITQIITNEVGNVRGLEQINIQSENGLNSMYPEYGINNERSYRGLIYKKLLESKSYILEEVKDFNS